MSKSTEYSPGVKYAVAGAVFHRKVGNRIELWDWTDKKASFSLSTLSDEDLEAIKAWTTEAEVGNE